MEINFSLKGQSNEIFDLLFFHHFNQPGPLTNGLKYFRIWFRFRRDIRILIAKKLTRRGMIPQGFKKNFNLRTVLQKYKMQPFNGKIRIHFYFCATVPLKACAKVLRNGC